MSHEAEKSLQSGRRAVLMYRSARTRICLALAALALLTMRPIATSQTLTLTEQRQKYLDILRISTLQWSEAQPFLLKADFQLFDLDGKPSDKGDAEEAWGSGWSNYLTFNSPSLPKTQIAISNRETYLLKQLAAALARPFPQVADANNFKMDEITREINGSSVQCFMVTSANVRSGSAYCEDDQNRVTAITGDLFVIRRTNFRKFHEHQVPMDLELSYGGRIALTMHVNELDEPTVQPQTPSSVTKPVPQLIPGNVLAGKRLTKQNPDYPKKAKKEKIEGAVLLTAIISKQGTIRSLEVIASPDRQLTESAVAAVKTWTYEPYLLNGVPTEIDTTITVNYDLNRKR